MTRILVIEDETPIRNNILEMLELEGYETAEAADGLAGIEQARTCLPDLIICDITMPEMDGYQVLSTLRDDPETAVIPFIFLTARSDRAFMRHGMELGADDYLTKPFTLDELRSAINARLERHGIITSSTSKEIEQARQTLVQMVAHELRTPLVSINTATEIISRQVGQLSTTQMQDLLDSIQRGGQRLGRLVDQIVLLTQMESGALDQAYIQASGMVSRVSELLIAAMNQARTFSYRQPDVRIRLDERDSDAQVRCDTHALRHALAELISNALTFSPQGGEVMIAQWQADGRVWISITDQGLGMTSEQMENALQSFHQIDRQQHEQQGIGLGLPLSRRIIELHSGEFEINSVIEKGTQITLSLPQV